LYPRDKQSAKNISCKINLILFSIDPCYALIGAPLDAAIWLVNKLINALLAPIIAVVKLFVGIIKAVVGPVIKFIVDIITFIFGPIIDLIKSVIHLLGSILSYFKALMSSNLFTYMYWKTIWWVKSWFPYLPISFTPFIIALFMIVQFTGGFMGLNKVIFIPLNAIRGISA